MRDLASNINPRRGFAPVAAAQTDNTAIVSQIANVQGYDSLTLLISTGTLADADATFTLLMEHGDQANLSDAVAVPDAMLIGTESQASFTFSADNAVFKIGYNGPRQYVRATITPANNTGAAPIVMIWIHGHPLYAPTPAIPN